MGTKLVLTIDWRTAAAQLFVVDYQRGTVEDHWEIDRDDVRASTFGLAVCS